MNDLDQDSTESSKEQRDNARAECTKICVVAHSKYISVCEAAMTIRNRTRAAAWDQCNKVYARAQEITNGEIPHVLHK